QTAGIGPRDFAIRTAAAGIGLDRAADAVGGTMYWGASAEVTFPITFLPKDFGMRGALYADAGSVWGYNSITAYNTGGGILPVDLQGSDAHKIRSSVGVGLLWNSPFGPIRFDYSFVLSKARGDQTQAFRFSGGTRF
ncbi:MAG: BamA/TamA family outer membrane protein, partial [Phreatobacter sp.]|nr:BamA/TamA family outer membrane protein [Phreatobacter sp.]